MMSRASIATWKKDDQGRCREARAVRAAQRLRRTDPSEVVGSEVQVTGYGTGTVEEHIRDQEYLVRFGRRVTAHLDLRTEPFVFTDDTDEPCGDTETNCFGTRAECERPFVWAPSARERTSGPPTDGTRMCTKGTVADEDLRDINGHCTHVCAICLEPVELESPGEAWVACNNPTKKHYYHRSCAQSMLAPAGAETDRRPRCPVCRSHAIPDVRIAATADGPGGGDKDTDLLKQGSEIVFSRSGPAAETDRPVSDSDAKKAEQEKAFILAIVTEQPGGEAEKVGAPAPAGAEADHEQRRLSMVAGLLRSAKNMWRIDNVAWRAVWVAKQLYTLALDVLAILRLPERIAEASSKLRQLVQWLRGLPDKFYTHMRSTLERIAGTLQQALKNAQIKAFSVAAKILDTRTLAGTILEQKLFAVRDLGAGMSWWLRLFSLCAARVENTDPGALALAAEADAGPEAGPEADPAAAREARELVQGLWTEDAGTVAERCAQGLPALREVLQRAHSELAAASTYVAQVIGFLLYFGIQLVAVGSAALIRIIAQTLKTAMAHIRDYEVLPRLWRATRAAASSTYRAGIFLCAVVDEMAAKSAAAAGRALRSLARFLRIVGSASYPLVCVIVGCLAKLLEHLHQAIVAAKEKVLPVVPALASLAQLQAAGFAQFLMYRALPHVVSEAGATAQMVAGKLQMYVLWQAAHTIQGSVAGAPGADGEGRGRSRGRGSRGRGSRGRGSRSPTRSRSRTGASAPAGVDLAGAAAERAEPAGHAAPGSPGEGDDGGGGDPPGDESACKCPGEHAVYCAESNVCLRPQDADMYCDPYGGYNKELHALHDQSKPRYKRCSAQGTGDPCYMESNAYWCREK